VARLVRGDSGRVHSQLEHTQRTGARREPAREQQRGEVAVHDELLEARGSVDHLAAATACADAGPPLPTASKAPRGK